MKKRILLCLALLSIPCNPLCTNDANTAPTPLTLEEARFIGKLFWKKKDATSYALGLTTEELNSAIDTISKKIKILQSDMLPENCRKGQYALMALGGLGTSLYAAFSSFLAHQYYHRYSEFISGTFKNAFVRKAKINDLSSMHFSFKEKKYLRRFKAENIIIGDWWYGISEWDKERTEEIMSQLSHRDREKVKYYALKETVNFHKKGIISSAIMPAFFIAGTIGMLAITVYGVIYHKELLEDQLEDYKNLYRIFKSEQERRLSLVKKPV